MTGLEAAGVDEPLLVLAVPCTFDARRQSRCCHRGRSPRSVPHSQIGRVMSGVRPGPRSCEFTAPEEAYVRKKEKLIFGPKKQCFLGGLFIAEFRFFN